MNAEYSRWVNYPKIDARTKRELLGIQNDENEIAARFSAPMEFGTAGLRSVMKAGIACMNPYTVAHTTTGLAKLILSVGGANKGVAIAYDSRNNSYVYAKIAAEVLAYHDIKVYFFESLRPTPVLSFAILQLGCISGINITASHNTKEYNGYKVYWDDGAQLPPDHAKTVSDAVAESDIFDDVYRLSFAEGVKNGIIEIIGKDIDDKYVNAVLRCAISDKVSMQYGDKLHVIYTPLHGTGTTLVPEVLRRSGITNVRVVESQRVPDGNFPTVKSPNPENKECFNEAFNLDKNADIRSELIIATDPDADRTGVTIKDRKGQYVTLTGNQIGVLLVDYIIKGRKEAGTLPIDGAAIRSVVSTKMFDVICEDHGIKHISVLTGFKYIGEKMKEFEKTRENTFLFGFEESHGFLPGTYARDKDAVASSMLIAEMAAYYKSKGKSLYDVLQSLYEKYGYYLEETVSISISGIMPMERMKEIMKYLRENSPSRISDTDVSSFKDYLPGVEGLPSANMLEFTLTDKTTIIVRPSGTEPKIKVYVLTVSASASGAKNNCSKYSAAMKEMIK